jgi:hypothetical protein
MIFKAALARLNVGLCLQFTTSIAMLAGQTSCLAQGEGLPDSAPPQILEHPRNHVVRESEPVTLRIAATGDSPLQYQWYFAQATNGSFAPIAQATEASHTIEKVAGANTGSYFCTVRNSEAAVDSRAAVVSLLRDLPNLSLAIVSPTNDAAFPTPVHIPTRLAITAQLSGDTSRHRWVEFSANGTVLGLIGGTSQFTLDWSDVTIGEYLLQAASLELVDDAWITFVSSPVMVLVPYGGFGLLPPGSAWRYHADGSAVAPDWATIEFEDAAWPTGEAQLGYGDGDERTTLKSVWTLAETNIITSYFRRPFEVADAAGHSNLIVRLLRDDGAVVYLNGVEVFRDNMPQGEVDRFTRALQRVNPGEESIYFPVRIHPGVLRTGRNVLAVELHQVFPAGADASFDLALIANIPIAPGSLRARKDFTGVKMIWPAEFAGHKLQAAKSLTSPPSAMVWEDVIAPVTFTGNEFQVMVESSGEQRFFRLAYE